MRKILSILIFCVAIVQSNAQKPNRFTKEEKALIRSHPNEMMRVYNLSNPTDSIVLKSVSTPIQPKHKFTALLKERMLKSVKAAGGVGIAAPQVGINRRIILVQRFDKADKPFEFFINPEIIWASELMQLGPEGDLSFDERGQVMRHYSVTIKYQNSRGKTKYENLEGFTAVIFQHERDHLDGILLIDRTKEQKVQNFVPSTQKSDLYFEEQI